MGALSLLQGIFPTQRLNPSLLHCRQILYQLSHKETPRILEWVACPFSSGSSQPRHGTSVSCFANGSFTSWGTREAHKWRYISHIHTNGANKNSSSDFIISIYFHVSHFLVKLSYNRICLVLRSQMLFYKHWISEKI